MRRAALLLALLLQAAPDGGWKTGLAVAKITPPAPMLLSGYASRTRPFEGVESDLYVKVLALEDGEGGRAVLVTADLIGWNASVADPLCERIMKGTGLERRQILLNASHTHSGPRISLDPRPKKDVSEEEALQSLKYTEKLLDLIVAVVARALAKLEPARLSWGTGVASFVMNRREWTERGIVLGVNPRGPVDRSVPVLRVDGADGKLRAVVFGAACHNTTLTGQNLKVSGDYAGFAQEHVEARHPGVQAMFVLGCGGDANPWPRGTAELARAHGAALGGEVLRVLDLKLKPVGGPLRTEFETVDLPFRKLSRDELRGSEVAGQALLALERGEKLPESYRAPVAVWQFGSDLTLVALPGETVVDFVALVERALGPLDLWVAGYSNDKFGYFPSARVVREEGYEAQGLTAGFGGPGFFAPEGQEVALGAVRRMAERAGRAPPPSGR
jgi:hypothetical protein